MVYNVTGLLNSGYKDPRYRAVIDRHFERGATLCVSCRLGITLTNNKHKSYLCAVATSDIMVHSFHANHQLHKTQVAFHFVFTYLTNNAAFPMDQSRPIYPKNAPIKKTNDKIFSQTEFIMSRRLAAHNKSIFI